MPSFDRSTLTIIVAEDNLDDAHLVLRICRKMGLESSVRLAGDGLAAIEAIDFNWAGGIALILLDLKMPKVTGHQVLDHLRTKREGGMPPVVVFTSSDQLKDIHQAFELGANAYVRKPVDFDEYSTRLERLLAFWISDNEVVLQTDSMLPSD